jgi:hypothetical protein
VSRSRAVPQRVSRGWGSSLAAEGPPEQVIESTDTRLVEGSEPRFVARVTPPTVVASCHVIRGQTLNPDNDESGATLGPQLAGKPRE